MKSLLQRLVWAQRMTGVGIVVPINSAKTHNNLSDTCTSFAILSSAELRRLNSLQVAVFVKRLNISVSASVGLGFVRKYFRQI